MEDESSECQVFKFFYDQCKWGSHDDIPYFEWDTSNYLLRTKSCLPKPWLTELAKINGYRFFIHHMLLTDQQCVDLCNYTLSVIREEVEEQKKKLTHNYKFTGFGDLVVQTRK